MRKRGIEKSGILKEIHTNDYCPKHQESGYTISPYRAINFVKVQL
jgi:hypothetical protein